MWRQLLVANRTVTMVKFVLKIFQNRMERVKMFTRRIFATKCKPKPKEHTCNHVVTIEDTDGRAEVTSIACPRSEKVQIYDDLRLKDLFFFIMVTLLWIAGFSFFLKSGVTTPNEKFNVQEYFICSCFIILFIVSVTGAHSDSFLLARFEKLAPKITIVVRKNPALKTFVLRIITMDDEEYIETEINDTQLTLNAVVEICSKELNLEKEKITCLYKCPRTRIRSDDDVKRFRRLEYITVKVAA